MTILSHPAVGGFVSHSGWNSTIESVWCGVTMATWPMYAEQQINALQLVKILKIANEIKMDYMKDNYVSSEPSVLVKIERGIRCLMDGKSEMINKMKEMKNYCREATIKGGSSYTSLGKLIEAIMVNIQEGVSD
ncbi:UDP-glucose flavonoid 3-O-glucosyltransferase 6-like [Apium graveolens]|uniref:UDP-glucose flavonoid 3-O-glucosyltransferase 6-like n=1 Tax=Apium graveolens TaxID=4045 RepID=UPI003D79D230